MLKLRSKSMETPKAKAIMAERMKKFNKAFDNPYYLRIVNNHFVLLEVSEALESHGFECFTAKDEYEREATHYVTAYKDGKLIQFGFSEVPYRWWVNNANEWHGDVICTWGMKDQFAYPYSLEYLISHAVTCTEKQLQDYERKKTSDFYVRLRGNFLS